MRFKHRDGDDAAARISLGPVRDKTDVEDGVFEVDDERDDFDDVVERLVAAGHEPLEESDDEDTEEPDQEDVDGDQDEAAPPRAGDFDEEEIVAMGYDELQSIAVGYDDIPGNASKDALTEALIEQHRAETDDGA